MDYKILPHHVIPRGPVLYYVAGSKGYLHKDNVWRASTRNDNTGIYTGFYDTDKDAELAVIKNISTASMGSVLSEDEAFAVCKVLYHLHKNLDEVQKIIQEIS